MPYRIDAKGGVHPKVDAAYERQVQSAIGALGGQRLKAARAFFEQALAEMEERPPNTRSAVKHAFESAEQVFMMLARKNVGLAADAARQHLTPIVERHHSKDESEKHAAKHLLASFEQWVHAGHKYRHANKDNEPHAPSVTIAVAYISTGIGHLRWLAWLDSQEAATRAA
jgi:hypothetical protein